MVWLVVSKNFGFVYWGIFTSQLDEEILRKAQSLLTVTLPGKGIKFEGISLISISNQEDRLEIQKQLFLLDQKTKDLDFERKLAEVENKEEFDRISDAIKGWKVMQNLINWRTSPKSKNKGDQYKH